VSEIYSTASVPAIAEAAFAELGPIRPLSPDWSDLDQAEILIVRGEEFGEDAFERAKSLRLLARTGSGVDKVDLRSASLRGIPVLNAPAAGARPVAEGTIALMLATMKRLGELTRILADGRWAERYEIEILDLQGATLGIVGYGRIGREVGILARGLGMNVLAHDPSPSAIDFAGEDNVEFLPLDEMLGRSDVVTLHCPLTEETRNLIDGAALSGFKEGAILLNVARGEIVAGDSLLLEALESGQLSGVGLDVFDNEPPGPDHPLLGDPRVVSSPHSIGLTRHWNHRVFATLAADVARYLRGESLVNVVNPDALRTGTAD
jgi:D-3-phosphoglycerate dehydrogenase